MTNGATQDPLGNRLLDKLDALCAMSGDELQLRIIYRAGYNPPIGQGKWMIGMMKPDGGGNGEWSSPFGYRFGHTMPEAIEAYFEMHRGFIFRQKEEE